MANVTFAVRGNSLNARYSSGGATPGIFTATTAPSVVTTTATGLIGGAYIDLYKNNASRRALLYPGGKNFSTNPGISILVRCAFQDNASIQGLWQIGGPWSSLTPHQMYMFYVSSQLRIAIYDETGTAIGNGFGTPLDNYNMGSFTPTVGQYYDILVTSTGVAGSSSYNMYIDGNFFSSAQNASSIQNPRDLGLMTHISLGTIAFDVNAPYTYINEFVIFDGIVNPASVQLTSGTGALNGASRTAFVDCLAFDGTQSTDPGTTNVKAPTAYQINGVSLIGNEGISTDPGAGNVVQGITYLINGVSHTGTVGAVQNFLKEGIVAGPQYAATLIASNSPFVIKG